MKLPPLRMPGLSRQLNHFALWLVVGLALSGLAGVALQQVETTSIRDTFERDVGDKISALRRELTLHFEVLHMLRSLYEASEFVSRDEFTRAARDALARNPTIQALEWVPRVPEAERARWEGEAHSVFPGFQFTAMVDEGNGAMLQAAREREFFYPVYYLEPLTGNEAALGFDLGSSPLRLAALEIARDSGRLTTTAGLRLVQLGPEESGFLAINPIYRGMPTTLAGRQESLYGYAVGVFRIGRLFEHAMRLTAAEDLHLRLLDVTEGGSGQLLYESPPRPDRVLSRLRHARDIADVGGRTWRLEATPYKRYITARSSSTPAWVAALLLLVVMVAALLVRTVQHQSRRVQREVENRTRELNAANIELERLTRTDPLTGVANRRAFDQYCELEWRRAARDGKPFALMLIDVDCFKRYNDFYGHQAGDICLRNVAAALQSGSRRASDLLARYGGEEFAMVIPQAVDDIRLFSEILRASVEALQIPHLDTVVERKVVTVSIGVVTTACAVPDAFMPFLRCADKALYEAKASGRNRIVCAEYSAPG